MDFTNQQNLEKFLNSKSRTQMDSIIREHLEDFHSTSNILDQNLAQARRQMINQLRNPNAGGPVSASVRNMTHQQQFDSAAEATSTTFASIKKHDGTERIALMTSNLKVGLDVQLDRGLEFYDEGKGFLLDIEKLPGAPIHDIHLMARDGSEAYAWMGGKGQELEGIQGLMKHLQNNEGGVGGMNINFDFSNLAERAHHHKDMDAYNFFSELGASRGWDAQVYFQAAGFTAGDASQQTIMNKLSAEKGVAFTSSEGIELHKAAPDNADALTAMGAVRGDVNREGVQFLTAEELRRKEVILLSANSYDPELVGKMFQVGKMRNVNNKVLVELTEGIFEKGVWTPSATRIKEYSNPGSAARDLNIGMVRVTPENMKDIKILQERINADKVGRTLRSLGPFQQKINDLFWWNPEVAWEAKHGPYGAVVNRVEAESLTILRGLREKGITQAARKFDVTGKGFIDMYEEMAKIAANASTHVTETHIATRVRQRVTDALMSPSVEQNILDSESSRLLDSPFGKVLTATTKDRKYGPGVLHGLLWEYMQPGLTRSVVDAEPRISLKAAGLSKPIQFSETGFAVGISEEINRHAANILLSIANEGAHTGDKDVAVGLVLEAMKSSKLDFSLNTISYQASQYITEEKAVSRDAYGAALRARDKLGMEVGVDDKFRELKAVHRALVSSPGFKETIVSSLKEQAEAVRDVDEIGAARAEKLLKFASELQDTLSTAKNGRTDMIVEKFITSAFSKDPTLAEAFRPRHLAANMNQLIELTKEQVEEHLNQLEGFTEGLVETSGRSMPSDVLNAAQAAHQGIFEMNSRLGGLSREASSQIAGGLYIRDMMGKQESVAGSSPKMVEALASLATAATPSASTGRSLAGGAHTMTMERVLQGFKPIKNKYLAPLALAGGVLSLMAAATPSSQGIPGDSSHTGLNTNESWAAMSEVPGDSHPHEVWMGQEDPFRLDVTFGGFIASREEHESLIRKVHDAVSNQVETRLGSSEIQDRRNSLHGRPAREAAKGF